eukprot:9170975-Lingulodinium_polyedra.AAC.1
MATTSVLNTAPAKDLAELLVGREELPEAELAQWVERAKRLWQGLGRPKWYRMVLQCCATARLVTTPAK